MKRENGVTSVELGILRSVVDLYIETGRPVSSRTLKERFRLAYSSANIRAILNEAGTDIENVLRFSAFVTRREHMAAYMQVRDRWVAGLAVKPASTLVIVSGFTRPEFLVEVEALALLPDAASAGEGLARVTVGRQVKMADPLEPSGGSTKGRPSDRRDASTSTRR